MNISGISIQIRGKHIDAGRIIYDLIFTKFSGLSGLG